MARFPFIMFCSTEVSSMPISINQPFLLCCQPMINNCWKSCSNCWASTGKYFFCDDDVQVRKFSLAMSWFTVTANMVAEGKISFFMDSRSSACSRKSYSQLHCRTWIFQPNMMLKKAGFLPLFIVCVLPISGWVLKWKKKKICQTGIHR